MVLKLGINEWPMPGRLVRRATYVKEYDELTHKDGMPFVPDAVWKDMFFSGVHHLRAIAPVRCVFRSLRPQRPARSRPSSRPFRKPDFFFLWLYAMLALLPPCDGNACAADRPGRSSSAS